PKLTDFLIETESELKNKVTWPTRKETTNNSVVVVVTCVIFAVWISMADVVFQKIQDFLYGMN
ncbi:MAG: preprotein translocase subunit SecE, partial [Planctomycetota bacterium]